MASISVKGIGRGSFVVRQEFTPPVSAGNMIYFESYRWTGGRRKTTAWAFADASFPILWGSTFSPPPTSSIKIETRV